MGSRKGAQKGRHRSKQELLSYRLGDLRDLRTFRATPKRHPRGTLSLQGPLDARGIFCIFSTKRGPVPKHTPVRSQVVELRLATLEAGDITLSLEWTPTSTVELPFKRRVVGTFGTGETWFPRRLVG